MKLKNVLIRSFVALTLVPLVIALVLLYKSGFSLSKESYIRNIAESINVQSDYIAQMLENNMVSDYRFAYRNSSQLAGNSTQDMLLNEMHSYLESSEDKIAACLLLDSNSRALYSIGETNVLELVLSQLPPLATMTQQTIMEFRLGEGLYTLGSITPVYSAQQLYLGSLISVYEKSYIFKTISSYYEAADSSTYICRKNGNVVNSRGQAGEAYNQAVEQTLDSYPFASEGVLDTRIDSIAILGYYKNIYNTPWYLVGAVDNSQIYTFVNQFVWVYILFILVVFVVAILLAVKVSKRVVSPINDLITVMDGYPASLNDTALQVSCKNGYYETRYLNQKFTNLMNTIMRVQHNFEGVYQLYQSSAMDDTNIDINVKDQTISSNKETFSTLMQTLPVPEGACIVERFTNCFADRDRDMLMDIFVGMRDRHLSGMREAEVFTPHFEQKWFHLVVVPMYEADRLSRLFVQLRDITVFKKQAASSLEQTRRDPLTGLYNRTGFVDRATAIMKHSPNGLHALLFADINDFKLINDNFGHATGDELLCGVAQALADVVRSEDIVARFGGDEFAIFLGDTTPQAVERVCAQIGLLRFPFSNSTVSLASTLSVGTATTCDNDTPATLDELLRSSDEQMYINKRAYKAAHEL